MRCPKCGGTNFDIYGTCLNNKCRYRDPKLKPPPPIPPRWLPGGAQPPSDASDKMVSGSSSTGSIRESGQSSFPKVKECPRCHRITYFWNAVTMSYECRNELCYAEAESQPHEPQQPAVDLSNQSDKSQPKVETLQMQLDNSKQDVEKLRAQLTQALQKIQTLQVEINESKSLALTANQPLTVDGELKGGQEISLTIELNQLQKIQGEIEARPKGVHVKIENSVGDVAHDFGRIRRGNLSFTADSHGRYTIAIRNNSNFFRTNYILKFTVLK